MSIFDGLPTVNQCCFCINLKLGSILIALFTIFNFGSSTFTLYESSCEVSHGSLGTALGSAAFAMSFTHLLLFIASFVFLYGIFQGVPRTATWYMYAVLLSIIANLIYVILSASVMSTSADCNKHRLFITVPAISLLMWIYFIIVVRSYKEQM